MSTAALSAYDSAEVLQPMSDRMARMVEPAVEHGVKEMSKGAPVEHAMREVALIGLMIGVGYPAHMAVRHVERKEHMMMEHHHHHRHHCEPCHDRGREMEVVMVEMPGHMRAGHHMHMGMHMPMHMPMQMPMMPGPGAYNVEAAAVTGYGSAAFPSLGAYFPLVAWT